MLIRDRVEALTPVDKVADADLMAAIQERQALLGQCVGWLWPSVLTGQIDCLREREAVARQAMTGRPK